MSYQVLLLPEAEEDIFEIYKHILINDTPSKADYVFNKIEEACQSLIDLPDRGHIPPELKRVGIISYKEIHFKPYRIIYETEGRKIYIHAVLDERRELQELLENRLLR